MLDILRPLHVLAFCSTILLVDSAVADHTTPEGLNPTEWRAVQQQIADQVDSDSVAAGDIVIRGSGTDLDLVRSATLSGDYSNLPAQTAANGPEFGYSVTLDGNWLAVGAPGTIFDHSTYGPQAFGAVFVFRRLGHQDWQLFSRHLWPSNGAQVRCGHSVALRLPNLVFGCPGAGQSANPDGEHGRIIYLRLESDNTWSNLASPVVNGAGSRCGTSIGLSPTSANGVAVMAYGCPGWNSAQGRVVVRAYDTATGTWGPSQALVNPSDPANGDRFGESLALYRTMAGQIVVQRLAVGAPYKTHGPALAAGSVYVFNGSSLNPGAILTGPAPQNFALTYFGSALAMNNTQLIVGARGGFTTECSNAPRCGTVARYLRSGTDWLLQEGGGAVNAGGNPPGEQAGMDFGATVAIGPNNWVAIAAPRADSWTQFDGVASDVGAVELRRANDGGWGVSWNDTRGEFRPGAIGALVHDQGRFGTGLDLDGDRLAIGYPRSGTAVPGGGRRGQVWIYEPDTLFANGFE